jgi:hypothetical protein
VKESDANIDPIYEDYEPAYRTGYEGYSRYSATGKSFNELEDDLQRDYEINRGKSNVQWEKAKHAAQDTWNRVERAIPGDIDKDGPKGDREYCGFSVDIRHNFQHKFR